MTFSSAYILVSHGSRDPRPQIAVERLAHLVRQQLEKRAALVKPMPHHQLRYRSGINEKLAGSTAVLSRPQSPLVATASLELAPVPLHESIRQIAMEAQEAGLKRLQVLPLFLFPGVHVKEDIPAEVALAQQTLGEKVMLELRPHLGSLGLRNLLAKQFSQIRADGRILLSHGSRLRGANQPIEAIASQLQAVAAYWSVSPSLAEQIETLAAAGKRTIAIGPYFLFAGGITEAIAQQVKQLQQAFPTLELLLGEPLGATAELANLIVEGMEG
ncbi:MAG: sirohydrochlorin chelatase [Xenococcaceae cyanobacterium]